MQKYFYNHCRLENYSYILTAAAKILYFHSISEFDCE